MYVKHKPKFPRAQIMCPGRLYISSFLSLRTSFGEGTPITPFKLSVLGATERFFHIESVTSISNWSPVFATLRVVKWKFQVSDSIRPEIIIVLQPSSNLSAEIIANCLSRFGVNKVFFTRVKRFSAELVQRCVTASIGSSCIAVEVLETFWSDIIA